jgi:polysaccharide deacetylase family protein (PEP-CTERM system associated)
MVKNILSVDIEEVFQTEYAQGATDVERTFRTPLNISHTLDLFRENDLQATFFIVGNIAEKFKDTLRAIHSNHHEISFHSYDHVPLWKKTSSQLVTELTDFNSLLHSVTGCTCKGFRAPSFSLDYSTIWALPALISSGIKYDSSIFPTWTPLYGVKNALKHPYKPSIHDLSKESFSLKIWEFPLTTYPILNLNIPASGGFYLRFSPRLIKQAIKHLNNKGLPAVLYFHNWELDPETPRLNPGILKSFITYYNLEKTKCFLQNLFSEFEFTSFSEYMLEKEMN